MKEEGAGVQDLAGYAVYPKMDCPHLTLDFANNAKTFLEEVKVPLMQTTCSVCQDQKQNWVCLECKEILCSRYVKEHMVQHNAETGHKIGLSFSDGSFWCYPCESYIDSVSLRSARKLLSDLKTQELEGKKEEMKSKKKGEPQNKEDVEMLEKMFKFMGINNKQKEEVKKISLEDIVGKMKKKEYKRIVVLTGAGLSVAAGIPDFRSPGSGLYSKLQKYQLPYPEAIFQISYYKKSPKAFLTLSKELLTGDYQPTLGHKFITKMNDEGLLHINLTQNIDDLEIKAGLPEDKLLQAHGHTRSAHCIDCKKEQDINKWKELAAKQEPMKCTECETGLVKPDIVFFGEQLPQKFFSAPQLVGEADLVFIIGTSLKVAPFSYLANVVDKNTPIVLINRQDVLPQRDYKLFLQGDIEQTVKDLMTRLEWK